MSCYDTTGVLNSPNVDARLHEYWTECRLHRQTKELTAEEFEGCVRANATDSNLPLKTRMKLLKFNGVRAA